MLSTYILRILILLIVLSTSVCYGQYGISIRDCDYFDNYNSLVHYICYTNVNDTQELIASVSAGRVNEPKPQISWSGPGILETGYRDVWQNGDQYPYVRFKATSTARMEVSWVKTFTDPAGNIISTCYKGYTIILILKPQPPVIQVDNPIVEKGKFVSMVAKPNYSCFSGPCITEWGIQGCGQISWQGHQSDFTWRIDDHMQFVARSKEPVGCDSELSHVNVFAKNEAHEPDCPTEEQNAVISVVEQAVKATNRQDYHYYTREVMVCNKTTPGCTAEAVFNTLLSNIENTAPNGNDIQNCLKFHEQSNIAHSKSLFPPGDPRLPMPVEHCQQINIPRPDRLIWLTAVAFAIACEPYYVSQTQSDPVFVSVDHASRCVTNYTMPGHTFYPGKVIRCVTESPCEISVTTVGVGLTSAGDNGCGKIMADMNTAKGLCIFREVDQRFIGNYLSR